MLRLRAKRNDVLTYYDRNVTTASKTRIGMILLKQKCPIDKEHLKYP